LKWILISLSILFLCCGTFGAILYLAYQKSLEDNSTISKGDSKLETENITFYYPQEFSEAKSESKTGIKSLIYMDLSEDYYAVINFGQSVDENYGDSCGKENYELQAIYGELLDSKFEDTKVTNNSSFQTEKVQGCTIEIEAIDNENDSVKLYGKIFAIKAKPEITYKIIMLYDVKNNFTKNAISTLEKFVVK
jgi:hypothetical protein